MPQKLLCVLWIGALGLAGCTRQLEEVSRAPTARANVGAADTSGARLPERPGDEPSHGAPDEPKASRTPLPADRRNAETALPAEERSPEAARSNGTERTASRLGRSPIPNADGYWPAPDVDGPWYPDYRPFDRDPEGRFARGVQALLDARDAEGLAALIVALPDSPAELDFGRLDGPERPLRVSRDAIARAIGRLFGAGSAPVVQGWFASDPAPDGSPRVLSLVLGGWQGRIDRLNATGPDSDVSRPASGTKILVWRFERESEAWRWRGWRWSETDYAATLDAIVGDEAPSGGWLTYAVPRPDRDWVPGDIRVESRLASPDGTWLAEVRLGDGRVIEPRDGRSWRSYRALVITDAAGNPRFEPETAWDADGFPGSWTRILGWTPDSRRLLLLSGSTADGCEMGQAFSSAKLQDLLTGNLETLPWGAGHRFDPSGYRLAYAFDPPDSTATATTRRGLAVRDLRDGATLSVTLEADSVESLTWSPSGDALAFVTGFEFEVCDGWARTGLARFDLESGTTRTLRVAGPARLGIVAWRDDGLLELTDSATPRDRSAARILVDALTGEMRSD